jgi:hypothetical protein
MVWRHRPRLWLVRVFLQAAMAAVTKSAYIVTASQRLPCVEGADNAEYELL